MKEKTRLRRQARIKKHQEKGKDNYVFPSPLAKMMEKINLRTQYEATMMSVLFILVGLTISVVYMFIYVQLVLWYKITLIVNLIAAMIFLSSSLITSFQQYKSYLRAMKFQNAEEEQSQKEMKGGKENEKKKKE